MNLRVVFNPGDATFDVVDLDTHHASDEGLDYYAEEFDSAEDAQLWLDGYLAGMDHGDDVSPAEPRFKLPKLTKGAFTTKTKQPDDREMIVFNRRAD